MLFHGHHRQFRPTSYFLNRLFTIIMQQVSPIKQLMNSIGKSPSRSTASNKHVPDLLWLSRKIIAMCTPLVDSVSASIKGRSNNRDGLLTDFRTRWFISKFNFLFFAFFDYIISQHLCSSISSLSRWFVNEKRFSFRSVNSHEKRLPLNLVDERVSHKAQTQAKRYDWKIINFHYQVIDSIRWNRQTFY